MIVYSLIKMDDGKIRAFTGYRIQHKMPRCSGKGGIRHHVNGDLDEMRTLAM
jgi:glutamate dehydrogenase/leucine dehydrogenase